MFSAFPPQGDYAIWFWRCPIAESSLSLGLPELRVEVAYKCGYGRTFASLSATQQDIVDKIVNSGVRQFYNHPIVPNHPKHEWSFLKPVTSLTTSAPYSTGTVAVTNASTTVTLSSGTFPTWAASGVFSHNNVSYTIATRDSSTQITLDVAFAGTTATGQSYSVTQEDYDLPNNFGGIMGSVSFSANQAYHEIPIIGENRIREMRQVYTTSYIPQWAAVRAMSATGTTGQRWEMLFFPAPDAAYTLSYRYSVLQDALSVTYPYPLGGMYHAETILQSCLAVAEQKLYDERGIEYQKWMELLMASVQMDAGKTQEYFGYNGDTSDIGQNPSTVRTLSATYNGLLYQ